MRLIDADALKELRHEYIQGRIKFDGNEYDLIDKCPTIEAEPVKHGKWMPCGFGKEIMCSVCGCELKGGWWYRHCPDCGANMDLDGDSK